MMLVADNHGSTAIPLSAGALLLLQRPWRSCVEKAPPSPSTGLPPLGSRRRCPMSVKAALIEPIHEPNSRTPAGKGPGTAHAAAGHVRHEGSETPSLKDCEQGSECLNSALLQSVPGESHTADD